MCVDTNAISDRTPNNAQNNQHKLGVAFSYLERKQAAQEKQMIVCLS